MKKNNLIALTLLLLSGCATLTEGGKKIKIVDPAELSEAKKCEQVAEVNGSAEGEGDTGDRLALVDMKNNAANLGANIVVSKLRSEKTYGWMAPKHTLHGQAFKCPEEQYAKLTNAESL